MLGLLNWDGSDRSCGVQGGLGRQDLTAPPCNAQLNFSSLDTVLAKHEAWDGIRTTLHGIWDGQRQNEQKVRA